MKLINQSGTDLTLEPAVLDLKWVIARINKLRFEFPLAYQRYYNPWNTKKKNSYIRGLWNNVSTKDLFIIVDIQSVLDNIDEDNKIAKSFKKELKGYLKKGIKWLVVDGQHRIKLIGEYTLEKEWKGNTDIFTALSGTCNIQLNNADEDQDNVGKKKFDDIKPEIKDWFLNQQLITVMVKKASLNGLKKLFINSNDGIPVSRQDKRNAGNSPIVDHINEVANHTIVIDSIFNRVNYTGNFAMKKRGHELITSTMLLFEYRDNEPALNNDNRLDSLFDMEHELYKKDENGNPLGVPSAVLKRHNTNMKTLAEFSKELPDKFIKQKGRLYNAYMFISLLNHNKNRKLATSKGLNSTYKIINYGALADWFLKSEISREKSDLYVKDKKGNVIQVPSTNKKNFGDMINMKNPHSYYVASHDARNDASTYLIMTRMLEDIMKNLDRWTTLSYIQKDGKAATRTQKEAAMYESNFTTENGEEQSGFTMYNGDEVEFDHIVPKSEGGTGEEGNLRMVSKKFNRERSNKKLMADEVKE